MMRIMFRFVIAMAVFSATLILTCEAKAGLLPTNETQKEDGNNFRYSYGIVLSSDSTLKTGDYFTIYDFDGIVSGSNMQPAGFTFSTQNVGTTPHGTAPTDNPNIANITWTYTGPTITGDAILGIFSVDSRLSTPTDGVLTAQTHRQQDDKVDANITEAKIPVPVSIPEPASLALVGIGLPLIGLFRRLRRRA